MSREGKTERWGAGVETQKNVRGEVGGWGRVPFNEPYAPSLNTINMPQDALLKKPYVTSRQKGTFITSKEPYITSKEPYILPKSPISRQGKRALLKQKNPTSPISRQKSPISCQRRTLAYQKSPAYQSKQPYVTSKEPNVLSKSNKYCQKSHTHCQKSLSKEPYTLILPRNAAKPVLCQKSPISCQKYTTAHQKSPTYHSRCNDARRPVKTTQYCVKQPNEIGRASCRERV